MKYHCLVIIRVAREVILSADVGRLLPVDGLQLGAVGDPVAEAAAIGAASLSVRVQELVLFRLEVGQEVRHLLSSFDEQVLEVKEYGVLDRLVDERRGVALLVATTGTTDPVDVVLDVVGHVVIAAMEKNEKLISQVKPKFNLHHDSFSSSVN